MAARIGDDGEITAVFPVIELHNLVFRSDPKTLAELIVNNGLNAGVVLPDEKTNLEAPGQKAHRRACGSWSTVTSIDEGELWSLPGGAAASLNGSRRISKRRGGKLAAGASRLDQHAARHPSRSSRRPCRGLRRRSFRPLSCPMSRSPRQAGMLGPGV